MKSMTGYGRAESIIDDKKVSIEIKSLNHRFLEIFVRLPGVFSPLEPEVKRKVTDRFARGRIEVSIRRDAEQSANAEGRLELNMPLIRNYYSMLSSLKQELQLKDEINFSSRTKSISTFCWALKMRSQLPRLKLTWPTSGRICRRFWKKRWTAWKA